MNPDPADQPLDEVLDILEEWVDIITEIESIDLIIAQMEE